MKTPLTEHRLITLHREISRRSFVAGAIKGAGIAAALPAISDRLWGLTRPTAVQIATAHTIFSVLGDLVIPVDEDPGWATFEPDITNYTLDVIVKTILLNGSQEAFDGFIEAVNHFNEVPATLAYNLAFLDMSLGAQQRYLSDILTGQFQNDGWNDVLGLAATLSIVGVKVCFFSNFPRHLATPGAEFQVLPVTSIKTGWDIMQLKGPVGPAEETALRAKYAGVPEIAGIDFSNPYL